MTKIGDVLYLTNAIGVPIRSIQNVYDIEMEHVLGGSSVLEFKANINENIQVEQQVIFRNERFIIRNIQQSKARRYSLFQCEASYISLSDRIINVNKQTLSVYDIAETILRGTKWSAISSDDKRNHSMKNENISILEALRLLASISNQFIKFNSIDYTIEFVDYEKKDIGFILTYNNNIKDIIKTTSSPEATRVYMYGKSGLSMADVNNKKDYVQDTSWYKDLGYSDTDIQNNFIKEVVYTDERFVYAGTVKAEALSRLAVLSKPQISYETDVTMIDRDVKVGDYGYVIDEELNIRVDTQIVKIIEYTDKARSKVELNYLRKGLIDSTSISSSVDTSEKTTLTTLMTKNEQKLTIGTEYTTALRLAITNLSSTHAQVGVLLTGSTTIDNSVLDIYFTIDGEAMDTKVKQNMNLGFNTIGMPFIIPALQSGTHEMLMFIKNSLGNFTIEVNDLQLFIQAEKVDGGMTTKIPFAEYFERVEFIKAIEVGESNMVEQQKPIGDATKQENVVFETLIASDSIALSFDNIDYTTLPTSKPENVQATIGLGSVVVSWDEVVDDLLAGYHVYKDGVKINDNLVTDTQYSVYDIEYEVDFEIRVNTQTVWGYKSEKSVPIIVNVPTPKELVSLVPTMTSNTTPAPYIVTSSGYNSDQVSPFKAFSKTNTVYWSTKSGDLTGWIAIDLGTEQSVLKYTMQEARLPERNARDWTIQTSNDGVTYEVVDTQVGHSWSVDEIKEFVLDVPITARYWKLDITKNNGDIYYAVVGEWDLFGYEDE